MTDSKHSSKWHLHFRPTQQSETESCSNQLESSETPELLGQRPPLWYMCIYWHQLQMSQNLAHSRFCTQPGFLGWLKFLTVGRNRNDLGCTWYEWMARWRVGRWYRHHPRSPNMSMPKSVPVIFPVAKLKSRIGWRPSPPWDWHKSHLPIGSSNASSPTWFEMRFTISLNTERKFAIHII